MEYKIKFDEETTYEVPRQGRIGNVGIQLITTNPNCIEFSTRRIISEKYATIERGGFKYIGDAYDQPEIMSLIWGIDGIESIHLRERYTMMISKAVSFSWDELIPQICKIIEMWQTQ